MKIFEINKKELNDFLNKQEHSSFLQSYEWGEFQKIAGFKIKRIGIEEEGKIMLIATLVEKKLPFGFKYFYCPSGPIVCYEFKSRKSEIIEFLFEKIKKTVGNKCIFLRFEPQFEIINSKFNIKKTIDIQPSKTLVLDLTKTEEELLKELHQKTRYNIGLAKRKGVEVYEAREDEFDDFWLLMRETGDRDGFRLHSKEYYKKMIGELGFRDKANSRKDMNIKLYLGRYKNKAIAASLVSLFGDTATYMHGASSNVNRSIMAPYLIQWETSRAAQKAGYKYYDFYGIDEKKWPGVTRFKKGFGGKEIIWPGTFDLILKGFSYKIYTMIRFVRRKI